MDIDWQWVIGGGATTAVTLAGAVYAEPRSYNTFIAPALKYLYVAVFLGAAGAFLGQFYLFQSIQNFIDPAKVAEAKKVYEEGKVVWYAGQVAAMLVFALQIILYSISEKAKEWKTPSGIR